MKLNKLFMYAYKLRLFYRSKTIFQIITVFFLFKLNRKGANTNIIKLYPLY